MKEEKKKILIHSLVFNPDGVSTAYLYNDIALEFQKAGYEVVVLSTTPHFNVVEEQLAEQPMKWCVWGLYKKSFFHGIPVYHVPQKKFKSTLLRLIGFVYWHIISFFVALTIKNVKVIISPSPPLTIGRLNNWLGYLKGCKVVYNVQEIYPDILNKPVTSLVDRYLRGMEKRVYNNSTAVTTIDQVFYEMIADRFEDKGKLHIIPNFVDTKLYHSSVSTNMLDKTLFPENDNIKLLYAGNIGFAQDWELLVRLVEKTKDMPIEYFLVGMGVKKKWVEEKKISLGLDKLHVLDYQPRQLMPAILAYSDLQYIFMTPEMEGMGFPSKVYTIMACGRPLLVCSGNKTPIVNFLKPLECAKLVTNHDLEQKIGEIVEWLEGMTREKLRKMGAKGERLILEQYAKDKVTKKYVELVDSLLKL
ncbi:glycosyltransferase family 4 protein [Bacteroides heparinolyticus]|uniref:glycosyltransferase family 4 protein n=1 Tax=Prevotella heparinolytica TaxID=28113 RepID=UPI0023F0C9FB|nr:glycosyltransferase family 4 protein [Bacteroides heparinolyticus]